MGTEIRSAIDFYERHPISSEIILAELIASRGNLDGVAPEELFPHDQDHYGRWKLMTRWLHVQISAKALASLIFVQA